MRQDSASEDAARSTGDDTATVEVAQTSNAPEQSRARTQANTTSKRRAAAEQGNGQGTKVAKLDTEGADEETGESQGKQTSAAGDDGSGQENAVASTRDENAEGGGGELRTPALRLQNCRAQKRYRERQRVHKTDMETELSCLRQAGQRLGEAERLNTRLEEQIKELEDKTTRPGEDPGGQGMGAEAVKELKQLQNAWIAHLQKLQGAAALDGAAVGALVDEGMSLYAHLTTGINAQRTALSTWAATLARTDTLKYTSFASAEEEMFWKAATDRIKLQAAHQQRLVHLREQMLVELEPVLQERRALNGQLEAINAKWQANLRGIRGTVSEPHLKIAMLQMIGGEVVPLLEEVQANTAAEAGCVQRLCSEFFNNVLLPSEWVRYVKECTNHHHEPFKLALVYMC